MHKNDMIEICEQLRAAKETDKGAESEKPLSEDRKEKEN